MPSFVIYAYCLTYRIIRTVALLLERKANSAMRNKDKQPTVEVSHEPPPIVHIVANNLWDLYS